jgi:hypothetical protein
VTSLAPPDLPPSPESPPPGPGESERLSQIMERLLAECGDHITLRQIAAVLDSRSFGAFLLIFALPNLIPLPPGANAILGLPLVFVGWQMMLAREVIWLPDALADYRITRARFEAIVARARPFFRWTERWIRPRHWFLDHRAANSLYGFFVFFVAVVVVIPIPFGNWLPAFALAVIGVAHGERDGIGILAGTALGLFAITIAGLVIMAASALLIVAF